MQDGLFEKEEGSDRSILGGVAFRLFWLAAESLKVIVKNMYAHRPPGQTREG